MMTRKDYVKVSELLNSYSDEIKLSVLEDLVYDFSEMFAEENPNFLPDKFYDAVMKNVHDK